MEKNKIGREEEAKYIKIQKLKIVLTLIGLILLLSIPVSRNKVEILLSFIFLCTFSFLCIVLISKLLGVDVLLEIYMVLKGKKYKKVGEDSESFTEGK